MSFSATVNCAVCETGIFKQQVKALLVQGG